MLIVQLPSVGQEASTPVTVRRNFWGALITQLRVEQRISQRQLATGAKVNRSTLRRIEDGTARGAIDSIERLLTFLGYELEALTQSSLADHLRRHAVRKQDVNIYSRAEAVQLLAMAPVTF